MQSFLIGQMAEAAEEQERIRLTAFQLAIIERRIDAGTKRIVDVIAQLRQE